MPAWLSPMPDCCSLFCLIKHFHNCVKLSCVYVWLWKDSVQTSGGTDMGVLDVQLLKLKKGCGLGALGLWCELLQPMRSISHWRLQAPLTSSHWDRNLWTQVCVWKPATGGTRVSETGKGLSTSHWSRIKWPEAIWCWLLGTSVCIFTKSGMHGYLLSKFQSDVFMDR